MSVRISCPSFDMSNKHVFDLDNTLVYTNKLNSDAYNYALSKLGIPPIENSQRITKAVVSSCYPCLSNYQKVKIAELKQSYFKDNIEKTIPNATLINILRSYQAEDCILWTGADPERVELILNHYELINSFSRIIYSNKTAIWSDVQVLCQAFRCLPVQLIVYEDNPLIVQELRLLQINAIQI